MVRREERRLDAIALFVAVISFRHISNWNDLR